MAGNVGNRARSRVVAFLERLGLRKAASVPDTGTTVNAENEIAEPNVAVEPEFAPAPAEPVTVESLRRVLDGLRQLS